MPFDPRTERCDLALVEIEPALSDDSSDGWDSRRPEGVFPHGTSPLLVRPDDSSDASLARALELVGLRWTLPIVRELTAGNHRFGQLRDSLGISSRMLSRRLHMLTAYGVVERRCYDAGRQRFEYRLTASGSDLARIVITLGAWADRHLAEPAPVAPERAAAELAAG